MKMNYSIQDSEDLQLRRERVQKILKEKKGEACLLYSFVNIYYLTGQMFDGYLYVPLEGDLILFVRKPADFQDERAVFIRKPEDIPALLEKKGLSLPKVLALEADQLTYNEYLRLQNAFNSENYLNGTEILRYCRMFKTPGEIFELRYSAKQHSLAYKHIPSLFQPGMTDLEFQYALELNMRRYGSIGIFRSFGTNMDIFMGSVLVGNNAAKPSPCDFALGGAGNCALPIGANGSIIKAGQTVMVDMAGNFSAYMTDMTRVYSYGKLPELAHTAHHLSIEMHNWLMQEGKPGLPCSEIYEQSLRMAEQAGLAVNFMGISQQAKFVGHGVGIEINELPVLTARSKEKLQPGMAFAFEPKFVIPEVGAVGIENTYLVTENGIEKITLFEEDIIPL